MIRRAILCLLVPLLAYPAIAVAKPYVTAADLDLTAFLPAPAKAGSDEDKAQQAEVLTAQKDVSPERVALARADADQSVFDMYTRTFGPWFSAQALPKTASLFARVGESEDATLDPAKPFYGRTRPFLTNPDIKPLVRPSISGSYPSGHATRVTAVAIILASMLPEKRDTIWDRAREYAFSRVVGGVHHVADIEAGYRAGSALAAAVMSNSEFKADYSAVRAELRAAFGL